MNLNETKLKAQIAIVRAGATVFLIDTAQLQRRTGITYVNGEARDTYADPIDIQCRLITRSGSESNNIAAQPRGVEQSVFTGLYRIHVPYDLEVTEGDRILYTDKTSGEVKKLDVIFAPDKHEFAGAVILQLQEVK